MKARWFVLVAGVLLAANAGAQVYVILTDGRRVEGSSIRARPDGTIVLTTATGTLEFPSARVRQAVAPRPPELDEATRALQERRYDVAIERLRDVISRFRFLTWDEAAGKLLGRAYLEKGELDAAINACEEHLRRFPQAEQDSEWLGLYHTALFRAGQWAKLEPRLNKLIAEGPRREAARAQLMRGDMRMAQNQLEAAVLDYLRVVMFYSTEQDIVPGAMLKVARTLEQMRDARARDWYRRLVEEYPSAPEAAEARQKI